MPFVQSLKKRLVQENEKAETVFHRKLRFDEMAILKEMEPGLKKTTGCKEVRIVRVNEENKGGLPAIAEAAVPGAPSFLFENIE